MKLHHLPAKWRKKVEVVPGVVNPAAARHVVGTLRYEARVAYLDGRTAQARKFNRYANCVEKIASATTTV